MGFEIRVYDGEEAPLGRTIPDQPDHFYSTAVTHARKSPHRFPLLARVDPAAAGSSVFQEMERLDLRTEWMHLESLAIGRAERAKWDQVFAALNRKTFTGMQFVGS